MKKEHVTKEGTFIATDCLQIGDVLLFRGSGVESKLIRLFSGGDFSHVAIITGDTTIYEADDYGVGESYYGLHHKVFQGVTKTCVFFDRKIDQIRLYRHPEMKNLTPQFVADTIKKVSAKYHAYPYSKLVRLVDASNLPFFARPFARWIVAKQDDRPADAVLDGLFCSEIVATFYSELGLELFPTGIEPQTMSPNHLAASELKPELLSALPGFEDDDIKDIREFFDNIPQDLPEAILKLIEEARKLISENSLGDDPIRRDQYLPSVVIAREKAEEMNHLASRIKEAAELSQRLSEEKFTDSAANLMESMSSYIDVTLKEITEELSNEIHALISDFDQLIKPATLFVRGEDHNQLDNYFDFLDLSYRWGRLMVLQSKKETMANLARIDAIDPSGTSREFKASKWELETLLATFRSGLEDLEVAKKEQLALKEVIRATLKK